MFRLCGILLQLFPQTPDVDIHGADVRTVFVSPDGVQQILPGVDPVGIAHEELDDIELLGGQVCQLVAPVGIAAVQVQTDVAAHQLVFRLLLFGGAAACGGGIYTSALEAAEKNNGKVIGVDSDQGGISPLIVTSAMKLLKDAVVSALNGLNAGEWDKFGGKQTVYDLTMGDVVGLPTAEASWRFSTFTVEEYNALKAKIADGTVTISNNTEALPTVVKTTVNEIA